MVGRAADKAVQFQGGAAMSPMPASSATTAMLACSGSTRAPPRSSSWRLRTI